MAHKRSETQHEQKEYFAFNTHLIVSMLAVLLFLAVGMLCLVYSGGDESVILLGVFLLLLVPLFVFAVLVSPVGYLFSEDHVTILYILGDRETILWRSVRSVVRYGSWFSRSGGLPHYSIIYPDNRKKRFYIKGEISVTLRTKRLMKRFFCGKIVG